MSSSGMLSWHLKVCNKIYRLCNALPFFPLKMHPQEVSCKLTEYLMTYCNDLIFNTFDINIILECWFMISNNITMMKHNMQKINIFFMRKGYNFKFPWIFCTVLLFQKSKWFILKLFKWTSRIYQLTGKYLWTTNSFK